MAEEDFFLQGDVAAHHVVESSRKLRFGRVASVNPVARA
jgi:hypothetical protein